MTRTKKKRDCGLYQIYGHHPVYGENSLLYIGKTENSFSERLKQHKTEWLFDLESEKVEVRVGRIADADQMEDSEWQERVDKAEALLIYSHWPAGNEQRKESKIKIDEEKYYDIHVLNWGEYGDLLPEVSGDRWTKRHSNIYSQQNLC